MNRMMNKIILLLIITVSLLAAGCGLYDSTLPTFSEDPASLSLNSSPSDDEDYFAVADSSGNLFAAANSDSLVKAFDGSGESLWTAAIDNGWINDVRELDDGRLIVSTMDGYFYILDKGDGGKTVIDDSAGSFVHFPAASDEADGFYYMKRATSSGDFSLMQVVSGSTVPAVVKDDFDSVVTAEAVSYSYLNSDTDAGAPVVSSDGTVFIYFGGEYKDSIMKVAGGTTSRIYYSYRIYSFSMLDDTLMLYHEPYDESIQQYEAIRLMDADGTLVKEIKIADIGPEMTVAEDDYEMSIYSWELADEPKMQDGSCYLTLNYSNLGNGSIAGCVFTLDSAGNYELKMQQVFEPRYLTASGDGFYFMDYYNLYQTDGSGNIAACYDAVSLNLGGNTYGCLVGLMPDGQNGIYLLNWSDADSELQFFRMPSGNN